MKNQKNIIKSTLLSGSIIAGALTGISLNASAGDLFKYSSLGSGNEIRAELLDENLTSKLAELECGEKSKTKTKSTKTTTKVKTGESKCGEGKCGDGKGKAHSDTTKTGEAKCGEHKK